MTLELYNFPASTCSLKVRICLAEKDLKWIDHSFKPHENKHLTQDYLAINPNGVVPTLVHDGTPIIDSSTILEYLDEAFPERSFSPVDPVGRARMRARAGVRRSNPRTRSDHVTRGRRGPRRMRRMRLVAFVQRIARQ